MANDPKLELLKHVPMFSACHDRSLKRIAALMDEVDLPAGKVVIQQGSIGQEFFVVVEGEVAIERDGQFMRTLGPGEFFGEISLIDDRPRSASATVTQPSRLLVAAHREFHDLMDENPGIRDQILTALAQRVRALSPGSE